MGDGKIRSLPATIPEPQLLQAGLGVPGQTALGPLFFLSSLFHATLLFLPQTAFPGLAQKSPSATFPGEEMGIV